MLKIGNIEKIEIEKIVFGGESLGYINGFAVFVPMGVPGDILEIEIISLKKTYGRGLIKKIINASLNRIENHELITFEDFNGCDRQACVGSAAGEIPLGTVRPTLCSRYESRRQSRRGRPEYGFCEGDAATGSRASEK